MPERHAPATRASCSERHVWDTGASIPSTWCFCAHVPAEIRRLRCRRRSTRSTLIDAEDGQRFGTEGTAADALYVLIQGTLMPSNSEGRIRTASSSAKETWPGVSSLLSNVSFGEDVIACGPARVLQIGKPLLDRLVEQHPAFEEVLQEILCRRLVATLLRTSSIFTVFDESTRTQIARLFEVRRVRRRDQARRGGHGLRRCVPPPPRSHPRKEARRDFHRLLGARTGPRPRARIDPQTFAVQRRG